MMNLKSIGLVLVLLIILLSIVLIGTNQTSKQSPDQTQSPIQKPLVVPTSYPDLAPPSLSPTASIDTSAINYSDEYKQKQIEISKQEEEIHNQALMTSNFVDKLPITGQYIQVSYNIYNNQIYLEYNKNNKDQASKEFAKLLKDNQIENVNWLSNLNIIER